MPMAQRLRDAYEYAENHRVHDHSVMLDAAREIEQLEELVAELKADNADWWAAAMHAANRDND